MKKNLDGMGRFQARRPPKEAKAAITKELRRGSAFGDMGKPNLLYMNALLDAVEAGERFRPHGEPSEEEIIAAYRATGRELPPDRQPGDDREEDAFRGT